MPRNNAVTARKPAVQQPQPQEPAPAATTRPRVTSVRSRRHDVDTSDHQVGQDNPRAMRSRGKARESLEPARIEPVHGPVSKQKLEALAFNEDVLTIMVHDSTNPLDDPIPEVWNDGIRQAFIRNREQDVKRKYVEVLARTKKTTYSQKKEKDGNGDEQYINVPHTALKFPFVVLHDPSPKGKAWLKAILSEA